MNIYIYSTHKKHLRGRAIWESQTNWIWISRIPIWAGGGVGQDVTVPSGVLGGGFRNISLENCHFHNTTTHPKSNPMGAVEKHTHSTPPKPHKTILFTNPQGESDIFPELPPTQRCPGVSGVGSGGGVPGGPGGYPKTGKNKV